jgi:hypothetical protein
MIVDGETAQKLANQLMRELAASKAKPEVANAARSILVAMLGAPHRFQERVALSPAFPDLAVTYGPLAMIKGATLLAKIGAVTITRPERPPIKIMLTISPPGPVQLPIGMPHAEAGRGSTGVRDVSLEQSGKLFDQWAMALFNIQIDVTTKELPKLKTAILIMARMCVNPAPFFELQTIDETFPELEFASGALRYLKDVGAIVLDSAKITPSTKFALSIRYEPGEVPLRKSAPNQNQKIVHVELPINGKWKD